MRAANSDTSDGDVSLDDCLSLHYQPVHRVPGFEVETADDTLWVPIAHRTNCGIHMLCMCYCIINAECVFSSSLLLVQCMCSCEDDI